MTEQPFKPFDTFEGFFTQVEQRLGYSMELAKHLFTEKVIIRMRELGINQSALAERLQVSPAYVARVLKGENNLELGTMVKIARALDADFFCDLKPSEIKATLKQ
ncbi:MAG: helix-turn-helix domain-containing protein [Verrucomicrobiales bacterium]